jgi:hypothetical protein
VTVPGGKVDVRRSRDECGVPEPAFAYQWARLATPACRGEGECAEGRVRHLVGIGLAGCRRVRRELLAKQVRPFSRFAGVRSELSGRQFFHELVQNDAAPATAFLSLPGRREPRLPQNPEAASAGHPDRSRWACSIRSAESSTDPRPPPTAGSRSTWAERRRRAEASRRPAQGCRRF